MIPALTVFSQSSIVVVHRLNYYAQTPLSWHISRYNVELENKNLPFAKSEMALVIIVAL